MSDAAYVALAAAIVRQAIADYMAPSATPAMLADLREFFHTSLIVALAGVNPKELLRDLDREKLKGVKRCAR